MGDIEDLNDVPRARP
jgi:echinoderm microtubule-associated protein-like 6